MIPELTEEELRRRRLYEALMPTVVDPGSSVSPMTLNERQRQMEALKLLAPADAAKRTPGAEGRPDPVMRGLQFAAEMAPGTGEAMSLVDFLEARKKGDKLGMGLSAVGMIPFVGMATRGGKGLKKLAEEGLEALASTGKVAASNLTDEAISTVFDGLTPEEALKAAMQGRHLKQNPNTGQYIGAPRGLDSPGKLGANRVRIDAKVEDGLFNAPWYDRARDAISRVSQFDPATMAAGSPEGLRAKLFARGGAAYSPQASPKKETNDFLKQYIAKTISGKDVKPAMQVQADNVARGFDIDPFTGRIKLTPDEIKLGNKTGPYGDAKDPTIPDEDLYDTANDLWHGRVMGYVGNKDDPLGAFDRGFSTAEHGWLTGENLLMAKRAQDRGLRPPGMESFDWTPRRVQAATWGAERKAAALAEEAERDAKYLQELAKYERAKAAGKKGLKKPKAPTRMTEKELIDYSKYGVDDGIREQLAAITPEFAPGGGTGLLSGFDKLPESLRNQFSRQSLEASGTYNPVLSALGQYQEPVQMVRGEWVDDVTGALESNLSDVARPLIATDANILKAATETKDAVKGGQMLSPESKAMLEFTAAIEGVTRGQQGVGMRRFTPSNSSFSAAEKTGARIAGSAEELAKAKKALQDAGLDVLDDGEGLLVGRYASKGQTWNEGLDGAKIQKTIRNALGKTSTNIEITPGRLEMGLERMPWGAEGSGQVAQYLDRQLSRPDVIAGAQRLDEGGFPSILDQRYKVAEQFGSEQGLPIRGDVQKLMDLLRQPNGFQRFQEYVRKNGYEGLPAIALMLGGAGLASQGLPSSSSPSPYQARRDEY